MRGKRGKKKKSGETIAALIQSTSLLALPQSPPLAVPSGTWPSTMGPRGREQPRPVMGIIPPGRGHDEDPLSDPESSLYDYQLMEEAGYSSVEFRGSGRLGGQGTSTPPREHAIDDDINQGVYHVVGPRNDIYATPTKKKANTSQRLGPEDLDQTEVKVHEAYRAVRDAGTEGELEEQIVSKVSAGKQNAGVPMSARDDSVKMSARSQLSTGRGIPNMVTEEVQTGDSLHGRRSTGRLSHRSETHTARSSYISRSIDEAGPTTAPSIQEENITLKETISRLNQLLSDYQAKYRPISKEESQGLPSHGAVPPWQVDVKYLSPLFLEYDNRLREKDELIAKYQKEMEQLRVQGQSIVKENNELHDKLDNLRKGPIDINEWEQLKENAKLVLEENQNLLEQIDVKDQKTHDMHQAHIREVAKFSKQVVQEKCEKTEVQEELEQMRRKYKELKGKHDNLVLETQDKETAQDFINSLAELKKNMTEKEESHKEEVHNLSIKIQTLQAEKKTQSIKCIELVAENKKLAAEMKALHRAVKKAQNKMIYLQKAIEQSENKEYSVQEQLASMIKVAEKTAFERDTYAKVAKDHECESKKAINKLMEGNVSKGKMEEKLKLYKIKAAARLHTIADRLKEQDESFNSQRKEYEREIRHLRNLLVDKDELVEQVENDKRVVEEELELVWQSANSENQRMKDTLRQNMKKLRKHAALSKAIDDMEPTELVYLSSDEK